MEDFYSRNAATLGNKDFSARIVSDIKSLKENISRFEDAVPSGLGPK